jgi:sterol O-acyltransferase
MKMHSYMAVNGSLQELDAKATEIEQRLKERAEEVGGWDQAVTDAQARRDELDHDTTPSETPALVKPGGSYFGTPPAATALRNRLQNLEVPVSIKKSVSATSIHSEASSVVATAPVPLVSSQLTIPAPHVLVDHPDKMISGLAHELSELESELTSTGKNQVRWPANLTWWNYIDYQLLPTLVYELEYPRTDRSVNCRTFDPYS